MILELHLKEFNYDFETTFKDYIQNNLKLCLCMVLLLLLYNAMVILPLFF
jgi:hypothetical protein